MIKIFMKTIESPIFLLIIIFWVFALAASIFYSVFAFKIHLVDSDLVDEQKNKRNFPWFIHQWWFNFVGSITGWIILWILLPTLLQVFCRNSINLFQLKDVVLLLIALLGITGHLPMTLFGIAINLNAITYKILKPS